MKEFSDDNFKFDEDGRNFSKQVENNVEKEKLLVMSNFSFFHNVFKRLVWLTSKIQGLFGKELKTNRIISDSDNVSSLPNDLSEFKAFAGDTLNLAHMMRVVSGSSHETFWEKEQMLVTSIFFFTLNILESFVLHRH